MPGREVTNPRPGAGNQQMLDSIRLLRGTAGDGIPASLLRPPANLLKKTAGQLRAVCELVHLGTQGIYTVKPPDIPLVGNAAQEAADRPALLAALLPQLPGEDALHSPLGPVGVKGTADGAEGVQLHLPCGFQIPVGPDVGRPDRCECVLLPHRRQFWRPVRS